MIRKRVSRPIAFEKENNTLGLKQLSSINDGIANEKVGNVFI